MPIPKTVSSTSQSHRIRPIIHHGLAANGSEFKLTDNLIRFPERDASGAGGVS